MLDLAEIVRCPHCGGEMSWAGDDLCCDCGYCLEFCDNFFNVKDKIDKTGGYAEFYTKKYYKSSLYDYTGYRLDRIIGFAMSGEGRRILDLGCGPGEIAVRCAKRGAEVFGIDVSRDALRLSAERSAREKVKVNLFEFDGEIIPFRDSTFDSIVLSDVVEHVEDETLNVLVRECARLLNSEGRLIIHTSPTKNIIALTKMLKMVSLGRVDLHSRLVNPDYEFLHVRYHSKGSLRRFLKRNSLHPVIWGEVRYLADSWLPKLLGRLGMGDIFSDQIWCVAFKDGRFLKPNRGKKPYMSLIEPKSEIDLGRCDDLYINYGFYDSEFDSFRWTEKRASLFVNVPEDHDHVEIQLHTSNPDVDKEPIRIDLYLGDHLISRFYLSDWEMQVRTFKIDEKIMPGMAELRLEVERTFVPKEHGMNEDPRELGVAIHRVVIA